MRQINPTGKSILIYGIRVKPRNKKYFAFTEAKSGVHISHPVLLRRASAVVTDVGRVAVDADVATDERSLSVRQRRVVLTPVCWRQVPEKLTLLRSDGGNRASAHRGERVISRKAIAQGRPGVLRCPVCSCAAFLALFAHGTAGAARTRSSLRPLMRGRKISGKTSGASRRETMKACLRDEATNLRHAQA